MPKCAEQSDLMNEADDLHDQDVACPRCGYDLHGPVNTWTEHCPMQGTCTECGLSFLWGDLLSKQLNIPQWSVESPLLQGWFGLISAACKTLLMSLRPWRFWGKIKMMHHPRWRRLVGYPLIILPLFYLVFALSVGLAFEREARRIASRRLGTVTQPSIMLILKAAVMPFSEAQPGLTTGRWGQSPRRIVARIDWLRIPRTAMRDDRFIRPGVQDLTQVRAGYALLMIFLSPMGFIALPISRRVCKVRWRHVARIWLYSLPLLLIPLGMDINEQVIVQTRAWYYPGKFMVSNLLVVVPGLLLIVWWSVAAGRYLKMTWPWLVGIAVVLLPIVVLFTIVESYEFIIFMMKE